MPEAAKHHKSALAHGESPEKTCRRGHPWLRDKYDRCIFCADENREKWRAEHPDKEEETRRASRERERHRRRLTRAIALLESIPTNVDPPPNMDAHWLQRTLQAAKLVKPNRRNDIWHDALNGAAIWLERVP